MTKAVRSLFCLFSSIIFYTSTAQQAEKIVVHVDEHKTFQTIRNFGASDAWSCQFVGGWPAEKKNAIADWLFSVDTFSNGKPKGIGLTLWRYNLGAGSAEQKDSSGIKDEWRRAALTTGQSTEENNKTQAQNWFLQAAKQRGVTNFLGFFNSPPVQLTRNGKAYATKGICNIDSNHYKAFADYTVKAMQEIKRSTGISFDYLSPVNEPQWDWSDGGQEGCPYNNNEISDIVKAFSKALQQNKLGTKLLITESGQLKYLLTGSDKNNKDDQVRDFFNPSSRNYIGGQPNINRAIASHSYFTTSPFADAMAIRTRIKDSIARIKNLEFWQSEYCILGDNAGEIDGNKRDTGMNAALYLAKVIYEDLVGTNATAWQWWVAISPYDYKDGLVYIDKGSTDGIFYDSKMLWAMGNYSRFVRPGMRRTDVGITSKELLISAYTSSDKKQLVLVCINESPNEKTVLLDSIKAFSKKAIVTYTTDATRSLDKKVASGNELAIPAKSVVTIIMNKSQH